MIESMKMQSSIASPRDGEVESVFVTAGQTVESDQVLMKFAS
jgi:biotin carboxyl carrier protein